MGHTLEGVHSRLIASVASALEDSEHVVDRFCGTLRSTRLERFLLHSQPRLEGSSTQKCRFLQGPFHLPVRVHAAPLSVSRAVTHLPNLQDRCKRRLKSTQHAQLRTIVHELRVHQHWMQGARNLRGVKELIEGRNGVHRGEIGLPSNQLKQGTIAPANTLLTCESRAMELG